MIKQTRIFIIQFIIVIFYRKYIKQINLIQN